MVEIKLFVDSTDDLEDVVVVCQSNAEKIGVKSGDSVEILNIENNLKTITKLEISEVVLDFAGQFSKNLLDNATERTEAMMEDNTREQRNKVHWLPLLIGLAVGALIMFLGEGGYHWGAKIHEALNVPTAGLNRPPKGRYKLTQMKKYSVWVLDTATGDVCTFTRNKTGQFLKREVGRFVR